METPYVTANTTETGKNPAQKNIGVLTARERGFFFWLIYGEKKRPRY